MDAFQVDINVDMGEGLNNEAALMPYISSCNIACGGHAGDKTTMLRVIELAKSHKVKVGAHPSFPDRKNFGRQLMAIPDEALFLSLKQQVQSLRQVAASLDIRLNHLKLHGALYNLAARDKKTAHLVVRLIESLDGPIKLYAPFNSVLSRVAEREGIEVVFEAFADRNYNDDLSLVSRLEKEALLTNKNIIFKRIFHMITTQNVVTLNAKEVPIKATTFCVHSDTKNASDILKYLSEKLNENGIKIR